MNLIERYLQEIERQLPRSKRNDIKAELQSALNDTLEDRFGPEPSEAEIVTVLKEFGPPRAVAASYHPEGQYLIGPALYPLFRMVLGIALAAVVGAQMLAHAIAFYLAQQAVEPLSALTGLVDSVPVAVGMVVIVFALLQHFGVRPESDDEVWDPRTLPDLQQGAQVGRLEKTIEIAFGIVVLVVLASFAERGLFASGPTLGFFSNPVISRHLGWIFASLLASLGVDLYILWHGRWAGPTRTLKLAANLFSLAVLGLLIQGHSAWLAQHGVGGPIAAMERLAQASGASLQVLGMEVFRMAFGVALLVTGIEAGVTGYKLARQWLQDESTPKNLSISRP